MNAEGLAFALNGPNDDVGWLGRIAELRVGSVVEAREVPEHLVVGDFGGIRVSEPIPLHCVVAHDDGAELAEPARAQAADRQVAADHVILGVRVDAEVERPEAGLAVDAATATVVVDIAPDDAAVEDDAQGPIRIDISLYGVKGGVDAADCGLTAEQERATLAHDQVPSVPP